MSELPTRLGERFTLGELIGRGTCSEVYRAHDLLLDRPAAVKIFPVAHHPRIDREIALLASLDHPSLVPVFDLGEVDGRAFVVMALFDGGSLADRLTDGPLPRTETLLALAEVAEALGHVHRAGVLHRDVTPRNVLFDGDGRAHLSDFGVAFVADAPRITDTGIVVGSAPYLAPEQVRGDEVGVGADVYALGLVMIEALTGRPPFTGTPLAAARERLERSPEIPGGLGEVGGLLAAMTADDPAARPSADDVCFGLRRAALADETSGEIPVVPLQPRPTAKARTLVVTASVAMSVLLAGTVVFASTSTIDDVSASTPPTAALVPTTAQAPPAPAGDGSPDGSSPDGSSSDGASSDGGSADDGSSNGSGSSSGSGASGSGTSESGAAGSGATGSGATGSGAAGSGAAGRVASPVAGPADGAGASSPTGPSPVGSDEAGGTGADPRPSSTPTSSPTPSTVPRSGTTTAPSTSPSSSTTSSPTSGTSTSTAPTTTTEKTDEQRPLGPALEALSPLTGALGLDG